MDSKAEMLMDGVKYEEKKGMSTKAIIAIAVIILGVVFLIIGIALIATSAINKECDSSESGGTEPRVDVSCKFSSEAKRAGLEKFLDDVKETFYKLHPFNIHYHPDVDLDRVRREYTAYNPTPEDIKRRTDTAFDLLDKISQTKINTDLLKPRERKALAQVKHYLKHVFGEPYDVNYYAGDWMLGPNLFCWQPVCSHGYDIYNALIFNKPHNLVEVENLRKKIESHKIGLLQYIENMKLGVRSGMVRSVEECLAGIDAIKHKYLNISLAGAKGVLKEWYVQPVLDKEHNYFENITQEMEQEWKKDHPKKVSETVKDYLVEYFGEGIQALISYLENEHITHCVPSNISSGLAGLPLRFIYVNGTATSQETKRTLPNGDALDGKKTYEYIMPYFTTNNMSPDEVHELGLKQLDKLYPGVQAIAREVTGINDTDAAVAAFRKKLNSSASYFNDKPIPKNESDKNAHVKCSTPAGAEKYCPTRWKALMRWFKESRRVMSMLSPKTVGMFYFTGKKQTTPNCPVELRPDLNPSSGAQSYQNSDQGCSRTAYYNIPFFLGDMGPTYSEWSVNAHEARPGHHTQVQGTVEHFYDPCGGSTSWLDRQTYYTAFTEGWALYAENPLIAEETDTYDNEPIQKFGMLKWQIWRAIRLIVDTGLHYKGWSRDKALQYFNDFAWDGTDLAQKEVTRYQSDPGQATAYMIGQLAIKKARSRTKTELKKDFDLREFHYQVLAQGSSPLEYLREHFDKYIACVQNRLGDGCDLILGTGKASTAAVKIAKVTRKMPWPVIRPVMRHHF